MGDHGTHSSTSQSGHNSTFLRFDVKFGQVDGQSKNGPGATEHDQGSLDTLEGWTNVSFTRDGREGH